MKQFEKHGYIKEVATGYSWKLLLFGVLYPLSRQDFKGAVLVTVTCVLTLGFALPILAFTHNKRFAERLITDGWMEVK